MKKENIILFLILFLFLNFSIEIKAQCTESYNWVKKENICVDPNGSPSNIFFINNAPGCNPGNGNMDLHVYFYQSGGQPAKAPFNYDPLLGASYVTTTPLPNASLFYLGSIDAPDLCAAGYFFTHVFTNSIACAGVDVTFFLVPWDRDLDSDSNGVVGEYNQTSATCTIDRVEFSVLQTPCNPVLDCSFDRTSVSCDGGPGASTVTVSGGVPPYNYQWSNGATGPTVTGLNGVYYLTVSDAAGCSKTAFTVISNKPPNVVCVATGTNVSCNGANDGGVSILTTGTFCGTIEFLWSTGDTSAIVTGLSGGTYTVTTTAGNCCPSVCQVTITEPPALLNVIGNVVDNSCLGASDGSAVGTGIGGITPYTFIWSNGSTNQINTGLSSGTYILTISDATGCIATNSIMIEDGPALVATITGTDVSCNGDGDGSLSIVLTNATNPITYSWSNGQSSPIVTGLSAGSYTVTAVDAKGCRAVATGTVNEPEKLSAVVSIVDEWCSIALGQATVNPANGNPPYTYVWSNGQMNPTATGLTAGTYDVSVLDSKGCCLDLSVVVTVDDCDLCIESEEGAFDICALLANEPMHPVGSLDCDNGGVPNVVECNNGGDPNDPSDDCSIAENSTFDLCAEISANPDSPLATADCDNGGVSNEVECNNSDDPFDPADDCQSALDAGLNLCVLINQDHSHPLATLDCDNGGIPNIDECMNGQDPSVPSDDCRTVIEGGLDICAILTANPTNPLGTQDCDNGGIDNQTECDNGTEPSDPRDDCLAAIQGTIDICVIINGDPTHPLASQDCDEGGVMNGTECNNGGDPSDPIDDCTMAKNAGLNLCELINHDINHPLATLDCDNGGIDNYTECVEGSGDPNDPGDDCYAAVVADVDLCAIINGDPNHPWATLDCDNGGIPNLEECDNGADPNHPLDDENCSVDFCVEAIVGNLDICDTLSLDPVHPLSTIDCDGDGVTNQDECTDNTDPLDPCDFVDTSITLPVTADQSGCLSLCPDLTPITSILPGNLAGVSALEVAVEITELNNIDTDGSTIVVRMPSDPRLVFVWDPGLTIAALTPVQNPQWNYLGDNGIVHTWIYNGPGIIIIGGATSAFGFQSIYDPQATDGQTTITASIVPFSGGECNILNDTDSERLVYFE